VLKPCLTIPTVIYFGAMFLLCIIFLRCILKETTTLSLGFPGFSLSLERFAKEKLSIFEPKTPSIKQKSPKFNKPLWKFSGLALDLGKGSDERHYFIGYFGPGKPNGFKLILAHCETIIGVDWDNTPQWDDAFEEAKKIYKFSKDITMPVIQGTEKRNNRQWYGVFASEKTISD
jgi:hypothetical protein